MKNAFRVIYVESKIIFQLIKIRKFNSAINLKKKL